MWQRLLLYCNNLKLYNKPEKYPKFAVVCFKISRMSSDRVRGVGLLVRGVSLHNPD